MNMFRLSIKNMAHRPLSTALSLILLTLGVAMISLVLQLNRQVQGKMEKNLQGIDMVVGAKGSPLQLILSAVMHVDAPTGNISLDEAEKLKKNRMVESAIPLSYGDSYMGYRIVGTDHQYLALYDAKLESGRKWESPFEVVIGATVAEKLGLKSGSEFSGTHGFREDGKAHDEQHYTVVGILKPSKTVVDQLILTDTRSVWQVHGNVEKNEDKEITAMLVQFRNKKMGMMQIPRMVNERTNMQAAVPSFEVNRLYSLMGVGLDTLNAIAVVIMIVAGISVFVSLYNTLRERIYEMALIRTYGASPTHLVLLVLQEGLLLAFGGLILGIALSRIGLMLISNLMEVKYHYGLSAGGFMMGEVYLVLVTIALGLVASIIPAVHASRLDISKTLAGR